MQSQARKFRLTGMGRNSQAVQTRRTRSSARPEVTRHSTANHNLGLRRPGFQTVSPAPETLTDWKQTIFRKAECRKPAINAVAVPRPSPGVRQQPKWSRPPVCNLPPGSQGNSFPTGRQQDPGARNGRFNSSRFRISRASRFRSSSRLSPPSLVALVPLRLSSQPPRRPQQTRCLRRSRRNHGLRVGRERAVL